MTRLLLLLCLFLTATLSGQHQWEAGLLLGGSYYQGDLTPSFSVTLQGTRPAYGLFMRRPLSDKLSLRANAFRGRLSGNEAGFSERALSFSTDITELSLLVEWKLFPPAVADARLTPYLFTGVGLLQMNPRPEFFNQQKPPPPLGVKEDAQAVYARSRFTLPFGFGLEYSLNDHWSIGAEVGLRTAFTDYLDGISFAGNPGKNDWYSFTGLSMAYCWGIRDQDGDGIVDAKDDCPTEAGKAIHRGCPDSDLDGIVDLKDDCPLQAGTLKGCPDSDRDGVADRNDLCPEVPGPLFRAGCPSEDSDGDGIPDIDDRCPQQIGPAYRQGCPLLDTDQDGIEDERDQCPMIPGSSTHYGCPEALGEPEANYKLFFEINSGLLNDQQRQLLNYLATTLARQPSASLLITGHADDRGATAANQELSLRRADACYDYLLQRGALPQQLHYDGFGESRPLSKGAPGVIGASHQLNRRVELELQFQ